jgi:hypothetical protein
MACANGGIFATRLGIGDDLLIAACRSDGDLRQLAMSISLMSSLAEPDSPL